jgi:hypothetical protein
MKMTKIIAIVVLSLTAFSVNAEEWQDIEKSEDFDMQSFPDTGKPWNVEDYTKALDVIESMASEDVRYLPTYEGKDSGLIFQRLNNVENLNFSPPAATSDEELRLAIIGKITHVKSMAESAIRLLTLYEGACEAGARWDRECIENAIFWLAYSREIISTEYGLYKVRPELNAERYLGMDKDVRGMIEGVIETIEDNENYDLEAREWGASALVEILPSVLEKTTNDTQNIVMEALVRVSQESESEKIKDSLGKLRANKSLKERDALKRAP